MNKVLLLRTASNRIYAFNHAIGTTMSKITGKLTKIIKLYYKFYLTKTIVELLLKLVMLPILHHEDVPINQVIYDYTEYILSTGVSTWYSTHFLEQKLPNCVPRNLIVPHSNYKYFANYNLNTKKLFRFQY